MQKNVLAVDNHPEIRKLMVEILDNRGYQVSTEADGHPALTRFALDRPDLVITSLAMPGLNGYQLCCLIRGISSVLVLLMSANRESKKMLTDLGPTAFCPNPSILKTFGLRLTNC